jgi:hypothetical protein
MRMHINRLGVAAGVIVLAAAVAPVAGVSIASASGHASQAPALKVAEEGVGTVVFRGFPEAISGDFGTFREQCVAHSDGQRFNASPGTQMAVFVRRSADAVCDGRPTQSTWFLSVTRPDHFKGMVTFSLSQDGPGGEYRIRCDGSTGNIGCRDEDRRILIEPR